MQTLPWTFLNTTSGILDLHATIVVDNVSLSLAALTCSKAYLNVAQMLLICPSSHRAEAALQSHAHVGLDAGAFLAAAGRQALKAQRW